MIENKKFQELYEKLVVPGAVGIALLCTTIALAIYNYYNCYCSGECLLSKVLVFVFLIGTLVILGYLFKEIYDVYGKKGAKVPDKQHNMKSLYDYMNKVLRLKHDITQIRQNLIKVGWTKEEIERAYLETREKIAKESQEKK